MREVAETRRQGDHADSPGGMARAAEQLMYERQTLRERELRECKCRDSSFLAVPDFVSDRDELPDPD
jgi:hypothetical protein